MRKVGVLVSHLPLPCYRTAALTLDWFHTQRGAYGVTVPTRSFRRSGTWDTCFGPCPNAVPKLASRQMYVAKALMGVVPALSRRLSHLFRKESHCHKPRVWDGGTADYQPFPPPWVNPSALARL
jgi:hypothetical protein